MKTRISENIMKNAITRYLGYLAVACMVAASAAYGQDRVQSPEAAGLMPLHGTIYVNDDADSCFGSLGDLGVWGVDFAEDHTVLISLQDSGPGQTDLRSMALKWTLYDTSGNKLIPPTAITNLINAPPAGSTLWTNTWLSFFRPDGTPTPGNVGRNPRVRGNRFGSGFVVAGRADRIGLEIPALLAINTDASGDPLVVGNTAAGFPVAQLMNNSGTPAGPVLSICNDADAQPSGNIWCHGVEVLANSNIVISAESRQLADLVNRFGGSANGNHVVYGVFKPNGDVVKAYSLVSDTNLPSFQFNNSIGVTSNGFAIRFGAWDNSATFRLFDNDGNPTSTNINMAARVGAFLGNTNEPTAGGGLRGDGVGWRGNYKDAYVNVCVGDQLSSSDTRGPVYVTVYNADGSVRYHRPAFDVGSTNNGARIDGAIAPDGRVVIAINDTEWAPNKNARILGRIFDPAGNPMGPHFWVSELETTNSTFSSSSPRVAWRDNYIAYAWSMPAGPVTSQTVLGYRLFKEVGPVSLSITRSAGDVVLSWPTNAVGFTLRSKGDLSSAPWQTNSPAPVINGSVFTVTEPVGTTNKFYQLIK